MEKRFLNLPQATCQLSVRIAHQESFYDGFNTLTRMVLPKSPESQRLLSKRIIQQLNLTRLFATELSKEKFLQAKVHCSFLDPLSKLILLHENCSQSYVLFYSEYHVITLSRNKLRQSTLTLWVASIGQEAL
jgi:hypothetical protein